ncbi:MAG: TIGR00269 family protein [Candidatus Diapherotrites archaeon]|nr:TIGR00269 family protein [Candidatus Diapherotrites archaeon]
MGSTSTELILTCGEKRTDILKEQAVQCRHCSQPAKIHLPYTKLDLCANHFTHLLEKRVKYTVRKYKLIQAKEKIVIGVSGGKDSMTTLHILGKYYSKSNPIEALMIDEGIHGYRDSAVQVGINMCKQLDIPYKVVRYQDEFDLSMDKIANLIEKNPDLGTTCSFCGVMRRQLLNKYSREMGADKLATGHNLDDEVQSVLMNITQNSYDSFIRTGATTGIKSFQGFIPRIKPLYEIPEKEIIAYTAFNNIEHYSHDCCPHSWQAKRNDFRKILNDLETKYPGTKYGTLNFFNAVKDKLRTIEVDKIKTLDMEYCKECGEPSAKAKCKACEKIEILKKQPI